MSPKSSPRAGVRVLVPAPAKPLPVAIRKASPGKAAKGWITINLPAAELKEMRRLARECGVPFNLVLRGALFEARLELQAEARLGRRTGLTVGQRRAVFGYGRGNGGN